MRGRALLDLGVAAAMVLAGPRAAAQAVGEATLYRCAEGSPAACLVAGVSIPPTAARQIGPNNRGGLSQAWRARFLGEVLSGKGRRSGVEVLQHHRLLLLVDVSGSMKDLRIGTVRLALRDFLRTLDSLPAGSVRVAVAPFGSVKVAARIEGARFTTPDSALRQLDLLPAPDRENTGLYSAVDIGVSRLAAEVKQAGADGLGVLAVVTDGDNDVGHPGDDPGLEAGDQGLARAARAVTEGQVVTSLIGIGNLNERALATLAGSLGRKYLVGVDAFALAQPLGELRDLLWSSWELAIPLATTREGLGRGWALLEPSLALGKVEAAVGGAVWRPPVVALPVFSGVVPAAIAPPGAKASAKGFELDRRLPLALMILVLLALLWLVVPRLLWPPLVPAAVEAKPAPAKAASRPGGLRADAKEAPPRRPTDVTAARARRA